MHKYNSLQIEDVTWQKKGVLFLMGGWYPTALYGRVKAILQNVVTKLIMHFRESEENNERYFGCFISFYILVRILWYNG